MAYNEFSYKSFIDSAVSENQAILARIRATQSFEDAAPNILGEFNNYGFHLIINDAELFGELEANMGTSIMYKRTLEAATLQFAPLVNKVLLGIFKIAIDANPARGAFPDQYKAGLGRAVLALPPPKIYGSGFKNVIVELPDLYEHLGTVEDFERGFHDKALLKGYRFRSNTRVQLPWDISQVLSEQRAGVRYRAWKALYEGAPGYFSTKKDSFGKAYLKFTKFPEGASWENTLNERLRVWGSKAPYWLLFEYGQPRWEPKIHIPAGMGHTVAQEYEVTVKNQGQTGLLVEGIGATIIEGDSVTLREITNSTLPANITGQWVNSLNEIWTKTLAQVWGAQVAKIRDIQANKYEALPFKQPPSAIQPKRVPVGGAVLVTTASGTFSFANYAEYLNARVGQYIKLANNAIEQIIEVSI